MKNLILIILLMATFVYADTPPPGTVKIKGGTDNTSIGNITDSLKVSVTNAISANISSSLGSPVFTQTVFSGAVVDPRARTWTLLNSTDSVNSVQSGTWTTGRTWSLLNTTDSVNVGNFPATVAVTQSTSPWVTSRNWNTTFAGDKIDASGSTVSVSTLPAITGTVTTNQGTSPWVNNVTQFGSNNVVTGTGASGLGVPRITVSNDSNILATQSGTWTTGRTWTTSFATDTINASGSTVNAAQSGAWSVTANAGTNLNTSLLALDSTVAKDASLTTINTSINTLLKPANTLTAVTTLGTITNALPTGTNSIGQVTANAGTNLNTSALALSANQTNGTQQSKITDGTNIAAVKAASTAAVATDPALVVAISPNNTPVLPSGAATETSLAKLTQTQGSTTSGQSGPLIQGAVTTNSPSYTTGQTSPISLTTRGAVRQMLVGGDTSQLIRNDYSTTNVTTAAYVQLVASTSLNINRLWIFDSSGQDFVLAVGGAGSEVDQIQISPGGWDAPVDIFIPSGSRISIKSKSATASSGILLITGIK